MPDHNSTWRWTALTREHQERARVRLMQLLQQQGHSYDWSYRMSYDLQGIDLSALALTAKWAGQLMRIGVDRVNDFRHEGRLPVLLELYEKGWPVATAFWRPIVEVWGEHKAAHPYTPGRGRRWEPSGRPGQGAV